MIDQQTKGNSSNSAERAGKAAATEGEAGGAPDQLGEIKKAGPPGPLSGDSGQAMAPKVASAPNAGVSALVGRSAVAAGGKPARYALLEIPNFNPDGDAAMCSYLRLGSVPQPDTAGTTGAPPSTGEDLASSVTSFLDDDRSRDGSPNSLDMGKRKAESAILHTKGGWRDHTDGNRITTTRGDKVEVIGGNYKMVVLGRSEGDAGWDVSGGHIEGLGAKSCIKWVQTFGGTWRTHEWSEKGDSEVIQHGNRVDSFYGESHTSTTGSEDEMRPIEDEDHNVTGSVPAPNPVIHERTWAKSITSYTGSAAKRVLSITSETWAVDMESETRARSMTDSTTIDEDMSSSTTVDKNMSSSTAVHGDMSSSTIVDGVMTETTIAAVMNTVSLVPLMNNVTVGNNLQVNAGAIENINLGAMLDITLANILQLSISNTLALSLGVNAHYSLVEDINLHGNKQEISGTTTHVSGATTFTTSAYTVLAAMINLA